LIIKKNTLILRKLLIISNILKKNVLLKLMHDMGKDTKYLTLAAIVLMGIATLIVLTSTRKKTNPSVTETTDMIRTTEGEDLATTSREPINKDLYAKEETGAEPDAVKDSYTTLAGDTKLVDETTPSKHKAKVAENKPVPAAYEETSRIKTDRLVEKGANTAAKKEKPLIGKPKEIAEDTGPVYIVQTSVLASAETAQKAQDALKAKGFKSAGVFHSGKNFLVYAGKFQSKESAAELKKRLDKAKIYAFVKELK
jgi:cell division septation protein DedD